jgi:anti-sigma28 factor (negative regulator of flagellin synthesis)
MKISDVKAIDGTPRVKGAEDPSTEAKAPKDRVSVRATDEAASAAAVARQAAGGRRAARAEQLEAEVRSGGYHPDPTRVAEQILADAEVDARISAMMRH